MNLRAATAPLPCSCPPGNSERAGSEACQRAPPLVSVQTLHFIKRDEPNTSDAAVDRLVLQQQTATGGWDLWLPQQEENISWLESHGSGHETKQPGPRQFTERSDVGLCHHCSRSELLLPVDSTLSSCLQVEAFSSSSPFGRSPVYSLSVDCTVAAHHSAVISPIGSHQRGKISRGKKNCWQERENSSNHPKQLSAGPSSDGGKSWGFRKRKR